MNASRNPKHVHGSVSSPSDWFSRGVDSETAQGRSVANRLKFVKRVIQAVLGVSALLLAFPLSTNAGEERSYRWYTDRIAGHNAGSTVGPIIGGKIGQSMDRLDRLHVQETLENRRTGDWVHWTNPHTGMEYTVTPTRTFWSTRFGDCRDYQVWVFIGGYEQEITGTACRRRDGVWQAVAN